jgi:ribose transport system substrate-binding protein
VAGAKAEMAKLLQPVSINYNPGPLGGSVAGKTLAIVGNVTPTGRHSVDLIVGYAKELGLKTKVYNSGGSAEQTTNQLEQVVNDANSGKVDAVLLNAFPPSLFVTQFNQLLAKKIPVGAYAVPDDPSYVDKLVTLTESPSTGTGDISGYAADWMIQDANGPVNAVVFSAPALPILKAVTDSFTTAFNQKCPTSAGCSVDVSNLDLAGIGSTMPGAIVSYLQAHPKVKYAFLDFGDMMIGVPAALKAAGITGVKFVSQSPSGGDVANIKAGTEAAEFAYPFSLIFHVALDALARGMLGKDTSAAKGWKFPTQLMVQSNVDGGTFNADGTTEAPGVTDFFKKIWTS